jgi:hypothetical protein
MKIPEIQSNLAHKLTERELAMSECNEPRTRALFSDIARLREQIRRKQVACHESGQGRPQNLSKRVGRVHLMAANLQ